MRMAIQALLRTTQKQALKKRLSEGVVVLVEIVATE
jgi:hypothetical protein